MSGLEDLEFADNQDSRCAIQIVLDCSDSMTQVPPGEERSPLEALNGALDTLVAEVRKDSLSRRRVELSFIAYGTEVSEPTEFATVDNIVLPDLKPMGITNSGLALTTALDHLEERKETYKRNGVSYYQPQLFWLTDGLSMDDLSVAQERIHDLESGKKLAFFPIGVVGADLDEMNTVGTRSAIGLQGLKFDELFQWISQSAASVSASQVGDRVALPSPAGWAEI